jgi:hypothetical protein
VTLYTRGLSHFVTSMTASVASGWSDRRVGLAPTGKAPPYHGAHPIRTFDSSVDEALQEFAAERKASMPDAFA